MSSPKGKLTVKQQRDARRAEKVAAFQKKQAAAKRKRTIGIGAGIVAIVAVVAVIATFVIVNAIPQPEPEATAPTVETWEGLPGTHTNANVDYEMSPPAGGPHNAAWLNCGVYSEPQRDENAVHSLEHGALWATYNPDFVSDEEVDALRDALPDSYVVLSPYPDLDVHMAISAWGAQIKFTDPTAEEVADFIDEYWQSADVPEPGGLCTGAVDGPGKVA